MAPWLIGAGLGLGLGALKNIGAQKREDRQRQEAATIARWSPWTGMQPGQIQRAGGLGEDLLSGGASGAMVGSMFGGGETAKTGEDVTSIAQPGVTDEFGVTPKQVADAQGTGAGFSAIAKTPRAIVPVSTGQPAMPKGYPDWQSFVNSQKVAQPFQVSPNWNVAFNR